MRQKAVPGPEGSRSLQAVDLVLLAVLLAPWIGLGLLASDLGADVIGAMATGVLAIVVVHFGLRHLRNRLRGRGHRGF